MKISKRAFTLLETAIALAVSGVALSMLSFLMVTVNNFNDAKEKQTMLFSEISSFKSKLSFELLPYQTNQFVLENGEQNNFFKIVGDDNVVISFEENNLKKNNVSFMKFNYLSAVNFSIDGTLVKCELNFGEEKTILVIIDKKV